jgi:hypothetical protein
VRGGRAVYVYSVEVDNGRRGTARVGGVVQSPKPLDVDQLTSIIIREDASITKGSLLRDFIYTEWRLDGDGYDPNGSE